MLLIPVESRRQRLLKRRSVVETSWILFPRVMASRLHQLRSKIAQASEFIAKQGCAYHKELLEKNKQQIVQPSTIEACPDLSKKLLYTRLASIAGHLKTLRKKLDGVKHIWRNKPRGLLRSPKRVEISRLIYQIMHVKFRIVQTTHHIFIFIK